MRCEAKNPATGNQCDMGFGHLGPHIVGGAYHPTERWVVQCVTECEYHHNQDHTGKNHWEECVRCGDRKPEGWSERLKGDFRFPTSDPNFCLTLSPLAKMEVMDSCAKEPSRVRAAWAKIRCAWYLLWGGMWRGECELNGWDKNDNLNFIASVTGSNFKYRAVRVFYAHVKL